VKLRLRIILLTAVLAALAVVSASQLSWAFSARPVVSAGHILERWDKAFVRHVHPVWLGENFPKARVRFVSQANPSNFFVWDQEVSGWSELSVDYSGEPLDGAKRVDLSGLEPGNQLTNHIVCQQQELRCTLRIIWSDAGKGRSDVEFLGVRVGKLRYLLIEREVLEQIAPELAAEAGD
jgi:hypothetical protein